MLFLYEMLIMSRDKVVQPCDGRRVMFVSF
jgi:hypothetical protein